MSGHSKWSTIKRKKGANDAARGKVFSKIAKEIMISVREGGANIDGNMRLRTAMLKARSENMPNTNIERAIKKALGENDDLRYEEVAYEGYACGGVAVIVDCLTENKNRTGPEVRHMFSKHGGSLGEYGCVSYMFKYKGVILIAKDTHSEDEILELTLDNGAENVEVIEDGIEIITEFEKFDAMVRTLETHGCTIIHAELTRIPDSYVQLDSDTTHKVITFIEHVEELDDVQRVSHNLEITTQV